MSSILKHLRKNPDLLMSLLAPPLVFHRIYKQITGSATASLLLSYLAQEPSTTGWVLLKADCIEDEIGLSRKELATARTQLKKLLLIEERRVGARGAIECQLNQTRLNALLLEFASKSPIENEVIQ